MKRAERFPKSHEYDFRDEGGGVLICLLCRDHRILLFVDPPRRGATLGELLKLGLLRGRAHDEAAL